MVTKRIRTTRIAAAGLLLAGAGLLAGCANNHRDIEPRPGPVVGLLPAEADAQGNKKVTITYDRFKQEIKAAGQTLSYDSAKPEDEQDPMMASMLSIFKKAKVEMTLDRDNNVTEVSGLDKLWDEMAGEMRR